MGDITFLIDNNRISGFASKEISLKQSLENMLTVAKGDFDIYSWNFGNELINILNTNDAFSRAEEFVSSCLLSDDRVKSIVNISSSIYDGAIIINFTVETIQGILESEVSF